MTATTAVHAAPLTLPKEIMEVVAPTETFPAFRKKWLSNEEVVSILISYSKHSEWLTTSMQERPPNGTVMLVNRKAVKYKKDGYCWKVRKDSTIIREDTMRLKIQCLEVLKCLYAHSSLVPTFHRRSYWLFINPDIVLVHYLNVNPEFTYSSLMGNPPALFTLPNYWPSSRPWSRNELLAELKPMYENCTNEDGTLQNGVKNVDELVSLIMEARNNIASQDGASAIPVKSNNQSCKLNQCQKSVPLKGGPAVTDPKSAKEKIADPVMACDKFRPILASTGLNGKPIPLVLNIQPVLAVVQTKLAVDASSEASKSKPEIMSEDRVIKSVSETSTQTCSDVVDGTDEGTNLECVASSNFVSNPQSTCSKDASGTSPADCGHSFLPVSNLETSLLQKSPSRVFARSKTPEEFRLKQCDYNFTPYASNSNSTSFSSTIATPVVASNFAHRTTLLSPSSVFDSTGSPLDSLSSGEHNFYGAQPKYSSRSRSIGSDLGFSESIDFSPSAYCNNPSSVSTIMYDIVSPPPPSCGDKTKLASQDATTGTINTTSSHNEPAYDLSCYHCDSFSSCGQASSVGGINSSGSSNSVLTEHTNMSGNNPSAKVPLSYNNSVLDSLQQPCDRETAQGIGNSSDSYIPDFSSSTAVQGFSDMADLSHHNSELTSHNEVFTSADLPDLSSMAGFNEQMCKLAPDNLPTTASSASPTANRLASQSFVEHIQVGQSVPPTNILTFVTEYSPNWCYEEGGEKILVAGNWLDLNSSDSFQCQFGEKLVPAALILPGVLRCLSPDYTRGIVPLSVLRNGIFLTHSVPFEYRSRPDLNLLNRGAFDVNNESDWLALDDRQFRYRLLSRLNQMQSHLTRLVGTQFNSQGSNGCTNISVDEMCPSAESLTNFEMAFEQKFVAILQIISQVQQTCVDKPILELPRPPRGLTMLHLAAALGMPRLIDMMRSSVSQLGGMCDVNPASLDDEHCSPLTWACARGNLECTLILHNWCHEMLHARNRLGLTPAMIAKQRGHILLVETLTEQVSGRNRNYKSARGKRPCPININERELSQSSSGQKLGNLSDFNFMPMEQQDPMSSCSEYDSEDNCSLSSNALGEFGGMTLSEIEQLAFNEGIGTLGGAHAQSNSPLDAHSKSMGNGDPLGHVFASSGGAADDADESDSEMDLSRSCSPYITTSLQVYNLAQQIIRAIPERIKRSGCQESQEVRDEFEFSGGGGGKNIFGQNCSARDHCCAQAAAPQHQDTSPPVPCCSRGGTAASWSICSSFDLLSDELDNDQMSECGGGAFGLSPDPCNVPSWSSSTGSTFRGDSQGVLHENGGFEAPMEDLKEFIQGRGNVEAELNSLTLTDRDQRTLYESAKIIQSAFRQYKQCREKRRQEIAAAILIQSYFRKYKQYFSYKRMCRAARLIQKVFRRYKYSGGGGTSGILSTSPGAVPSNIQHDRRAAAAALRVSALAELNSNKLFPQNRVTGANSFIGYLSRHDVDQAVLLVQRNYRRKAKRRRENDAALKIQRFLRQCKNNSHYWIQTLRNNGAGDPTPMMWSFV